MNILKSAVVLATCGMIADGTALADTFGTGANQFTIDFVAVGDPGNPNDSGTTGSYSSPRGGVAYEFRMGAYEVSRDMILKANTDGGLGITLYDLDAHGIGVGNGDNRPAGGVSWNEAARFINWLNMSSGYGAAYKFTLQPGETGYSANANIELWSPGDAGYNPDNLYRNADALYFLPSEDEWYKAAYYSGSGSTYYDFATQQDAPNTPLAVSGGSSGAVYNQAVTTGPADIDNAGIASHYGTEGQNGNVFEWTESAYDSLNNLSTESRAVRGGSWAFPDSHLNSSYRGIATPSLDQVSDLGFRVASVPEPSTELLLLVSLGALLRRLRARQLN